MLGDSLLFCLYSFNREHFARLRPVLVFTSMTARSTWNRVRSLVSRGDGKVWWRGLRGWKRLVWTQCAHQMPLYQWPLCTVWATFQESLPERRQTLTGTLPDIAEQRTASEKRLQTESPSRPPSFLLPAFEPQDRIPLCLRRRLLGPWIRLLTEHEPAPLGFLSESEWPGGTALGQGR